MKTVWAKGKQREFNTHMLYRAKLQGLSGKVELRVAAENIYRVFGYNTFVASGPQRGPHHISYYSTYDVTHLVQNGVLVLTVEVNGCNADCYYYVNEPPYFGAEVYCNGQLVADTDAFICYPAADRLQKVLRYSFQRSFCESYRMSACRTGFYMGEDVFPACEVEQVPARILRPRSIHEPTYPDVPGKEVARYGIRVGNLPEKLWRPDYMMQPTWNKDNVWGYRLDQVEEIIIDEVERFTPCAAAEAEGTAVVYSLGRNVTGFMGVRLTVTKDTTMYILFDELLKDNGLINPRRMTSNNAVKYVLAPGKYDLLTFEPYTLQYMQLVFFGDLPEAETYVKAFENPDTGRVQFTCADKDYEAIFNAARNTFAQNAVDVLTDCPSRERAGWLCDSYFSGQSEPLFTGENIVEQNFLRNYTESDCTALPKEMVPMCYPSSHPNHRYIPNWAMFYILELESYLERTGDRATIDQAKARVMGLVKFFEKYENEYGLLEKLDSWVFVEWSFSNQCVQDVSFPSNMLWAKALDAVDTLYGCPELAQKAKKLRQTINEWSFNGEFYIDNALRTEKGLELTENITETCQYYAFFCGVATPESRPGLLAELCDKFGVDRDCEKVYPNVHPANAFIGNLLRLDYLSKLGKIELVLRQMKEYYLYMANTTGTLWEMAKPTASCNHGFAGYVANIMMQCMNGFVRVSQKDKRVYILKDYLPIDCCLKVPVGGTDYITVTVQKGKREVVLPQGYTLA